MTRTNPSGRRRRAVSVLVALTAGMLLNAEPSLAHVWRTGQIGCSSANFADSASHGFWYDNSGNFGLSTLMRDATSYARAVSYDPTDISTFGVPALAFDTDVVLYDWDVPPGWCGFPWHTLGAGGYQVAGLSQCRSLSSSPANACEQFEIDYDESWTNNVGVWDRIALACHEVGHTLGFTHETWSTSCMDDPIDPSHSAITYDNAIWLNLLY